MAGKAKIGIPRDMITELAKAPHPQTFCLVLLLAKILGRTVMLMQ